MASTPGLCQHSDPDGSQCTSADYVLCPHCQLQLCLKHLNTHQTLLRADLFILCEDVNRVRATLNQLNFDPTNHQQYLLQQLDHWYHQHLLMVNKLYHEKKERIQTLYLHSRTEFEVCKSRKEKQLENNLSQQLKKVLNGTQVLVDDLNDMKCKLDVIQRGLNELQQPNIEISFPESKIEIQILKRRYIDAAKSLFDDDDGNHPWDTDQLGNDDERVKSFEDNSSASSNTLSVSMDHLAGRKAPLKLVIKRLQHSTLSTDIKYRLQSVNFSSVVPSAP